MLPEISHFRIIVDTSFLMMNTVESCLQGELAPLIQSTGKKLAIPKQVIHELEKLQQSSNKEKSTKSRNALKVLKKYSNNWFQFFGEEHDAHYADHLFNTIIVRHFITTNLVLLTQDRGLAHDICLLNSLKSFPFKPCMALRKSPSSSLLEAWERLHEGEIIIKKERIHYQCPNCRARKDFNHAFLTYMLVHHIPICFGCKKTII
jgi:rRNA-processing protein FCF1